MARFVHRASASPLTPTRAASRRIGRRSTATSGPTPPAGCQGTDGKRQAYHFHLSGDRPFAFAGRWERWHGDDGAALESCCLLTTGANAVVRPVHDRMPVLLDAGDIGA